MENTFIWTLLIVIVSISVTANGCTIEGLDWSIAASESILDIFKGNIWNRSTSDIEGIIEPIEYAEGLNKGPYVAISYTDSRLLISTNNAFEKYEEYETAMSMGFTITFRCTGGSTGQFVFEIKVIDTNNNDPQFRLSGLPTNTYEYTIAPPIPPGFLITNCVDDIIVRDIDLTTQRIDFEISGSSLFQIAYDSSSTLPKEFKAALRTTTLIRSVPEPIIFNVTATDVDTTGDPRRTATAIVKIIADTEFTFPEEPIFSQPFYLATYTTENELILQESIILRQGFDEQVVFSFEGQYSHYFDLVTIGNGVSFKIKEQVPVELYKKGQIFLVVKAERNYTSGATATVVVQLPKVVHLAFEAGLYEGSIEDNELNLGDLQLKQGYEDTTITVDITTEYKSYFIANVNGSIITLSMNPLSDSIIRENHFINLHVIATTALNSTATTIVTLGIIKDDLTTPVFERNIYTGSYDTKTGLSLEQIMIIQGYDNTVTVTLEGEHSTLFDKKQNGPYISLSLSSLPSELLVERNILVSVRATKPRTVGANAVIQITLPKARELSFEKFIYKGNFEKNIIALETIVLNVGYDSDVIFNLTGDHADYFNLNVEKNEINLGLKEQLPEHVLENSFLVFGLSASGTNTVTASATILLEIIKQDTVTPVFSKYIYGGTYINSTYIDFETISLIQGYDDTVTFDLDGAQAQYFSIISTESRVMLTLKSTIPEDLIFNEKVFLLNLKAEKPGTLGANAAISLRFPQDLTEPAILKFSQNTYSGILKDGKLTVDNIVLESGFTTDTKFVLSGDNAEDFSVSNSNNVIAIKLSDTASLEDLQNNKYVILEIEATRERAVPVISTLIVDIPDTSVIMPVFDKAFYTGTYKKDSGLEFTEEIVLQLGFDKMVTFKLEGDTAQWFSVIQDGNSVSLISNVENPLPYEVFLKNNHLLFTIKAQKPGTLSGQAAISINLIKKSDIDTNVSFDKVLYNGNIKGSVMTHEPITLSGFNGSNIDIIGELATSFEANVVNGDVTVDVALSAVLPENLSYIALTLQADSATAVLILDVTPSGSEIDTNVSFDKVLYNGNIKGSVMTHEPITLSGFNRSNINIIGELATSFEANVVNGDVTVDVALSAVLPENLSYIALTLQADSATAVLILDVMPSGSEIDTNVSFDKLLYNGNIKGSVMTHEPITLSGFNRSNINIIGELATSFEANVVNGDVTVNVALSAVLPENLSYIALTLQADSATAVLILDVMPSESDIDTNVSFDKVLYNGNIKGSVMTHEPITLSGFNGSNIDIIGELATSFEANVVNGDVTVDVALSAVLPENLSYIALTLQADSATAVLILDVTPSGSEIDTNVSFDKVLYNGNIKGSVMTHEPITLSGFNRSNINIIGELATSFEANVVNGDVTVDVALSAVLPENLSYIALTLQADSATAVLILDVMPSGSEIDTNVSFDKLLYNGNIKGSVMTHEPITLSGFNRSNINIIGELATSFEANVVNGDVTVDVALSAVLPENLSYIALTLQADSATAVLILDVTPSGSEIDTNVSFDKVLYNGNIKGSVMTHEPITLSGFNRSNINIIGELATSFKANVVNGDVTVNVALSAVLPENLSYIALTLQADSATAVLILDVMPSGSEIDTNVLFDKVLYNGNIKGSVMTHEPITLSGFNRSNINIIGELATSFEANVVNGDVTVDVALSAVLPENLSYIALTLQADSATAVLILDVTPSGSEIDTNVSFDKVLYNGNIKGSVMTHEPITLSGFNHSNINIIGELATSFEANVVNGDVTVNVALSAVLPENLSYIALTLQADSATAVLILDVMPSDAGLPVISFDSPSYFFWADLNQTGTVGRVKATVDNEESVLYSINVDDDLLNRVSINAEGGIILSMSVDRGIYNFKVTATATISRVSATAQVILRVDALPECSTEDGLPPLIVLERVEEEPHLNLVVLNETRNKDCWYTITNLWPEDQSWLYVDNGALHARAIDREHKSIAFMISSQIQVEVILHCDNDDESAIVKRSLTTGTGSEQDPYNYGSNKWVLADTITYNARRSVVNLIVEDINDNSPIFVGKENEPIYVGYPMPELENTILPRALIELKATDADIGENAALKYWSLEENLAVAPTTGYVHVRNNALLENNSRLTMYATDQNGKGLNGTLDIVVKLLDRNQIAVITVQNAFLDDENSILSNLSKLVGYDVKILRTVVISDRNEGSEETSRKKRETVNTFGASLQLFVYGMSGSQLVNIDKLTSDLGKVVAADTVRVTSLEDHLEALEIRSVLGQNTALLAATITLAVILFILIVAATVWFLLKWKKKQNYQKVSDANSLSSRIETEPTPKPESSSKSRLDIEELKKSERRLQEMLDAPVPEITVHPPKNETNKSAAEDQSIAKVQEKLINIAVDPQQPIIIQSIDKLKDNTDDSGDEFGEVKMTTPRKSVVTFNENVEKIIHLEYGIEDNPEDPEPEIEIYRF